MIACAGGSASGKTTVARCAIARRRGRMAFLIAVRGSSIIGQLNVPWVAVISMDSFYKELTPEQRSAAYRNEYDFDCPGAR